jgi:hypothetical protein
MKRLIIIAIVSLMHISSHAQTKMTEKEDTKLSPTKTDGFMMKDGKLMQMKDGLSVPVEDSITLKNGSVVLKDGTVKAKDGKTVMLKTGDWIMKDGTIKYAAKKKKSI